MLCGVSTGACFCTTFGLEDGVGAFDVTALDETAGLAREGSGAIDEAGSWDGIASEDSASEIAGADGDTVA